MDPQKITELAILLRNNGDKILSSEFTLTLSGILLRALNDSFTLIADSIEIGDVENFQVVKPINSKSPVFRDLQLVHDFVQKTALLRIVHYASDEYFEGLIDIVKFRALKKLEVLKINITQIQGIQKLRGQLQHLTCVKSIKSVDDIITRCGADNSNGFVWNELKSADFSYNNLHTVDSSLEFAQYLQYLNLGHNQLQSVKAIKWLPHLKNLDLSFNRLQHIPQFHIDAYKRLQSLNMSSNLLEDLSGIIKLDALTDLDLSDNFLLDHSYLLPLSTLINLRFLNLNGNPLHCHSKHRMTTAHYLHKNCCSVNFALDFETLNKSERSVIGTQQLRQVATLARFYKRSSSSSISTIGRNTAAASSSSQQQTPASSVGSLASFKWADNSSGSTEILNDPIVSRTKKKSSKIRCVQIEDEIDDEQVDNAQEIQNVAMNSSIIASGNNLIASQPAEEEDHLETKRQIKNLREKYGNEWLQTDNAEMMKSVLGIDAPESPRHVEFERQKSRKIFDEYLKNVTSDISPTNLNNTALRTSTPTDSNLQNLANLHVSPIHAISNTANKGNSSSSHYQSLDQTQKTITNTAMADQDQTVFKSLDETKTVGSNPFEEEEQENFKNPVEKKVGDQETESITNTIEEIEEDDHLKNIYSSTETDEPEYSEPEEDEETYIVYTPQKKEALFLTKSSNFLRERDPLTERTKCKWSLKILESCDRMKSNTLRLNFDTVKKDKQERVYIVEEDLCQQLEKKLRDILSQRDLTEMNQTIYRCVNCNSQFSRENKFKRQQKEIRCPDCKSHFVAEIHEIPKSLEKVDVLHEKLSPASIVEELPTAVTLPLNQQQTPALPSSIEIAEETQSIGKGNKRLSTPHTPLQSITTIKQTIKRSAASLNDTSSCSKLTSQSMSSFNSNQSLVGSSNTDRDIDFKTNGESDVDIISNPSQSSIEVLDQYAASNSRKTSHIPMLETIDDDQDQTYTQTFLEREFDNMINYARTDQKHQQQRQQEEDESIAQQRQIEAELSKTPPNKIVNKTEDSLMKKQKTDGPLTESSSSGSVTDSICTQYEQNAEKSPSKSITETKSQKTKEFLNQESNAENAVVATTKKEDNNGLTTMFGALIQSTNVLLSSSKKLNDFDTLNNVKTGTVVPAAAASNGQTSNISNSSTITQPYKFNYTDFNEIDHRLKLFFYQTKFEDKTEHFKWIVKGRIFNENTKTLLEGIVVMSTCKLYIMEAFAKEHDDVTKWLRLVTSCTVDRLESIQLLPWKMGLSFYLRGWGGFLLLLQDILRTDSIMLFFANNSLPSSCDLQYQPADILLKRLNSAVLDEQLNMYSLLNGCEITCDNAKRSFAICGLLTTDTYLYLTSQKLNWLSLQNVDSTAASSIDDTDDIEVCLKQLMSNLVEIERCSDLTFIINFLDETQNKCELWKCTFETADNANTCLNAIGQSWQKLFGVPLINV